jgi:DTW domain-containing protein YfiP
LWTGRPSIGKRYLACDDRHIWYFDNCLANDMSQDQIVVPRDRCYDCFRPREACFCASIPTIDNQTHVLILQHRRERFHPFNTARIVHKALRNSQLLADHTSNLAKRLRLNPRAVLLYPGPTALPICDLASQRHPEQLVVLDGTWHHAKTLVREIPALQSLPRYRLAPTAPSRYRIRREPSAASLSTLEATIAALMILEPQTGGFDQLMRAFELMVEDQLAHPRSPNSPRFRTRRIRTYKNIPRALLGDLENIVVAYGESAAGERGCKRIPLPPISWVAQRLGSGETFSCTLIPPRPLDDVFLGHLALTRSDFDAALTLDEARRQWAMFRRPSDVVTVFHPGTAHLFSYLAEGRDSCLVLKSVDLESYLDERRLEGSLLAQEFPIATPQNSGRAGKRLASAIAFVRHLNAVAMTRARENEHVVGFV